MEDDFDDAAFAAAVDTVERGSSANAAVNTAGFGKVQQPKPQLLPTRAAPSNIIVSTRQKGNPVLNNIRSLPWEYGDISADFVLGNTTCALFLSLKYHRLHPEYIYARIKSLGGKYNLRVLLTMVDIQNHEEPLKELSKTSLVNNLTLILSWSAQEAGRYLELFKSYEHASPTSIRAHQSTSYKDSLIDFITVPRSVNKTDAVGLVSNFGSIRAAVNAQPEEIGMIAGWGEKKVQRWYQAVNEPFRLTMAASRGLDREQSLIVRGSTEAESSDEDEGKERSVLAGPKLGPSHQNPVESIVPQKRTNSQAAILGDDSVDQGLFVSDSNEETVRDNDSPQRTDARHETGLSDGMQEALVKLRSQRS